MFEKIKKWIFPIFKFVFFYLSVKFLKKNRRKVLLIAEFGEFGGTRTYFFYLLDFLYKQKYEVNVLLYDFQQDAEVLRKVNEYNFTITTNLYDFERIAFNDKVFTKFNINPLKKTVHALNHYLYILRKNKIKNLIVSVGTAEKYLFMFLLPVRIVYIIHTVVEHKLELIRHLWLKFFLGKQNKILTVSAYSRKAIIKNWGLKSNAKVYFIYNYVDKNIIVDNYDKKIILTIGNLSCHKNPFFWIELAKGVLDKLGDKKFVFVWVGDGKLLTKCRNRVKNYTNIKFVGSSFNVDSYYRKAILYLQPSLKESFGLSVVQAMAYKIPCVVSNRQALPEIVSFGNAGFIIDVNDKEYSVEQIVLLLKNEKYLEKYSEEGYSLYKTKFLKRVWENNMIDILKKYLS